MTTHAHEGSWINHSYSIGEILHKLTGNDSSSRAYNMLYDCVMYMQKYPNSAWNHTMDAVAKSYHITSWKMFIWIELMLLRSLFHKIPVEFLKEIEFVYENNLLFRLSPKYICRNVSRYFNRTSNGDLWKQW